ncbi:hypothetical protein ABGN05_22855 [Aquibium sp. LZ166]|uniref:Tat pathway signal sequence domain protein n=1 Tax=Aquibium pacificus TaxID=3153579 RepID=A0ABV3SRC4_9HYPH
MPKTTAIARMLAASITMSPLAGATAFAQEAAAQPSLTLELNGLEPSLGGCRLTFLVRNGLGAALEKAAFEIALFDRAGLVQRLTALDFKDLPDGKTKVRQFDLAETDCAAVGRVLVNGAVACEGEGVEAGACIRHLDATTKAADVAFGS